MEHFLICENPGCLLVVDTYIKGTIPSEEQNRDSKSRESAIAAGGASSYRRRAVLPTSNFLLEIVRQAAQIARFIAHH